MSRVRDLAGQKFGKLTSLYASGKTQRGSVVWVCNCDCGREALVPGRNLVSGNTKSCGCLQPETMKAKSGPLSSHWKGGKRINRLGYVIVTVNGKEQKEHRVVMEKLLGRKLESHENVHHKNGIRNDNDPKNLELWSTSQPSGQRVEDKAEWAIQFLLQYGYRVDGAGRTILVA